MALRDHLRGYAFITPNFLGFALFTALPVLGAIYMSVHDGTFSLRQSEQGQLSIDARYVGLDNFKQLLGFRAVRELGLVTVKRGDESVTVRVVRPEGATEATLARWIARDHKTMTLHTVERQLLFFCGASTVREFPVEALVNLEAHDSRLWQASDPLFWFYLWNTCIFLLGIPISMACSLALAILLNQKIKGQIIYRTLLFLPSVAGGVAMFLVWRWIYNPNVGLLNSFLATFGLIGSQRPDWLGDPSLVRPAIIAMGVFMAMGGTNMILFLAGLQGIDPTLYEAADIDGAGPWDKFRHITWPQLQATTFFILTTNLIAGFQMFDQAFVMTNGGPEGATTTIVYYIYQMMFNFQKMGYAAAIAISLFFIILLVTLVNSRLNNA